jgi:WD40 repeat protein
MAKFICIKEIQKVIPIDQFNTNFSFLGTKIVFKGHKTGVNSIAFSNDGFILASGGKASFIMKIFFK